MRLSASTFQYLLEAIRADRFGDPSGGMLPSGSGPVMGHVVVIPLAGGADRRPVKLAVREVSLAGIGLLQAKPMKAGEQFVLRLPIQGDGRQRGVVCTVTRWQILGERLFLVAAVFDRELSAGRNDEPPATGSEMIAAVAPHAIDASEVRRWSRTLGVNGSAEG